MSGLKVDSRGLITACPACGAANRLPFGHLGQPTRCGKCHGDLRPPAAPVDVPSMALFDALVASSSLPVLVDFWAEWCGPCKMIAPSLEEISDEHAEKIRIAKVNVDLSPDLARSFNVMSIPTMIMFKDGEEVARFVGAKAKPQLVDDLSDFL